MQKLLRKNKAVNKVEAIEEVQKATEAAMSAVIDYLRTNKNPTSEEAHSIISSTLERMGCEEPEGNIVAGGKASAEPHEMGSGRLKPGEPIVIDIYPRSKATKYFADMSRTVCLGQPSAELQKMYDAVLGAQELALSMVKPGAKGEDIQIAVENFFTEHRFITSGKGKEFAYAEGFVHSVGHGVSTELHDKPKIGRGGGTLAVGDIITIEPGLYYKHVGGIRIEDMVLVTKEGYRDLTNFSKKFEVE